MLNRWLTVKPMSVANPETALTPISCLRQCRQTGCGGWISAWQEPHSWKRSRPSAPDVQKNAVSGVSEGRGRPGATSVNDLCLRIQDRFRLPDRHRLGEPLLVADLLKLLQGLLHTRPEPGAGGEGGRQVPHALDDADGLVVHR